MERCVWLIAGPTASGKSALALRLAEATGGEIVNADSMQLYSDLKVLSARPGDAETARAPHHLYGVADAATAWSTGTWLRAATAVLSDLESRGRSAIVVGGTGLYFAALTRGLADIPEVPIEARASVDALWNGAGEAAVRAALRDGDPVAEARIASGDRQRLVRALSVLQATGAPLSEWRTKTTPVLAPQGWRGVVIKPDRADLYARCDARLRAMIGAGAMDEVAALTARKLDPQLPAMKALGVREIARHLANETTLAAALVAAQQATRNYAKRQLTWFRNQTPDWPRITELSADAAWCQFRSGQA